MPSYSKPLLFLYKVMVGLRGFVMQNYTEANVKNGTQFEYSADTPSLAAGESTRVLFMTGDKPVIIKSRTLSFTMTKVTARVYKNAQYTGGTPTDQIFNLNDINPEPTTVQIVTGATLTDDGEEFGAPNFMYGSTGVGNSENGTFATPGIERVLAPNTTYMLLTTNSGEGTHGISTYLTWYEGDPDLPAAEGML